MADVALDWKALRDEIYARLNVDAIKKEFEELKHAEFKYIPKEALDLVTVTVVTTEKAYAELTGLSSGGGEEKRAAVVSFLDDIIRLPFFLDKVINLDGVLLGYLVDYAVTLWNKIYGNEWANNNPFPPTEGLPTYNA